jgi:nucleoside 2-deoxyribosyltransferase
MTITSVSPRVYLAGPILGCTQGEAMNWRATVAAKLEPAGIVGVSPLRCEPIHGDRYTADYPDPCFGVPRAIAGKNRFDVRSCDMGLYFVPKPEAGRLHSLGTIGELFWANGDGKQTILVSNDPFILGHPVIDAASNWKLDVSGVAPENYFDDAIRVIIGVLGAYSGGKNI